MQGNSHKTTEKFLHRDISWLSFNQRVLEESVAEDVPLKERLRFLGIFTSNLDEFYRVRMPVLKALRNIKGKRGDDFDYINKLVYQQQVKFGAIIDDFIVPLLKKEGIIFRNTEGIPAHLNNESFTIFNEEIFPQLKPAVFSRETPFFPENNRLYTIVFFKDHPENAIGVIPNPTPDLPRFYTLEKDGRKVVVFIEDIIRMHAQVLFTENKISKFCNIKVTRDAELNLQQEYEADLANKLAVELKNREQGLATRMLYEPCLNASELNLLLQVTDIPEKCALKGGPHHAYKDLMNFPLFGEEYSYEDWPPIQLETGEKSLLSVIQDSDVMVHPPYHDYGTIIRFFKEAAKNPDIEEIYTSIYRVATESKVVKSLIKAAKNGKKVFVIVELKARFDESNNLNWSKKMKKAGIKIIYSSVQVKVHAKIALIKYNNAVTHKFAGLLATGNLNEITARIYTDHVLLTTHQGILEELFSLFQFLLKKQKPEKTDRIRFKHLLVSQFNLQNRFFSLIEREIKNKAANKPAGITIKLNNLEEQKLIRKLYKASMAGVKINLLVRGICCLKPGVPGLSEHIQVKRIVDRYLEHGRVFVFENNGNPEVFMGSADWMIRNIYRRIEVCFPVYDAVIRKDLIYMLQLQFRDNIKATLTGAEGSNLPIKAAKEKVRSQYEIFQYLLKKIEPLANKTGNH